MSRPLAVALMLALLSSGVEGAVDSVRVAGADDGTGSAPHELHDHDAGTPSDYDGDDHAHVCHCSAHAPPLSATAGLTSGRTRFPTPGFIRSWLIDLNGPPPLPPPIL